MIHIAKRRLLLSGAATIATIGAAAGAAHAQSTPAGTVVSNTAKATYSVNGTQQTATSNTATFVVDRKVNLAVATSQSANTQVNIGDTDRVLTFQVTNTTNGTQDLLLSASQAISVGVLPGPDDFDATNVRIFVDSNGNGIYDPGVDTATYIDELGADQSRTVFIVADIPNQANESLAFLQLRATVAAGGAPGAQGTALVPTPLNTVNQDNEVDIVFVDNDSDGAAAGDTARNGQGVAYAAYEVGARNVNLSVFKSSRVVSDGFSTLNPKAIPGAVVEYCLVANNATLTTPATNVLLRDVVPANTTYVPNSIQVGLAGGATACLVGGVAQPDDGSNQTGPYRGSYDAATNTVSSTITTLAGGTSVATSFRVTIN